MFIKMKVSSLAFVLIAATSISSAKNYQGVIEDIIESDSRNQGVEVTLESKRNDLWFCVKSLEDFVGPMDVFRVFLQSAGRLKEESFDSVKLCYGNAEKFSLPGTQYSVMGKQLETQNIMYTIRTFPKKLALPTGSPAFEKHRGGVLYEMKWQMRDFKSMNEQWYLVDVIEAREAKKDAMRPKTFAPDEEVF
ncbi:hypothetical protein [Marinomonas fungiae]|uniref:Uncharacterized protein n=1 Tax=Marinomonas fungiae TaxID=1137284 RepID=A0A0K6ILA1_9GAMM|nr:hypothetical protein [Marinomonas fungiae]CUB04077.1 hypothetical protein Ga0061065_105169 [Marinomonas fungiae]